MSKGQGCRHWVKLDTDPAILTLLEKYVVIIQKKAKKDELPFGKVAGAIIANFLLPQRDRILNEYQKLLLQNARYGSGRSFNKSDLEAVGLSEIPNSGRANRKGRAVSGRRVRRKYI